MELDLFTTNKSLKVNNVTLTHSKYLQDITALICNEGSPDHFYWDVYKFKFDGCL